MKSSILKLFLFFTITGTLNSCGSCNLLSKQYYFAENSGVRPVKNSFKLRKNVYTLKDEDKIKTNSVYQSSYNWNKDELKHIPKNCENSSYTKFIRFFNDGKVLINNVNNQKTTLEQYNDLNSGEIGYYTIETNKLIIEYFSVSFGGMTSDCGKYYRDKYKITKNGIQLVEIRRSDNGIFYDWKKVEPSVPFIKTNIEGLSGNPNW